MVRSFGGLGLSLSRRSQSAVFALLTLSLLLGAWRTWLSPERLLLDSRRARRDTVVTELARLQITAAGLPAVQRQIKELEARLAAPAAGSTDASGPDTLLELLDELATQSGLELITFTQAAAAGEAKRGGARVQIELDGRFPGLVVFLGRLSASGRLASAPDLMIKPHARPSADRTVTAGIAVEVKPAATSIALGDLVSGFQLTNDGRDPFRPIASVFAASSAGSQASGPRAAVALGLNGISASDVTVTGIARAGDLRTAILQAPDRRTFVVKPQDQLLDAAVTSVNETGVVFAVRPPRNRPHQPVELRKTLARLSGAVR